MSSVLVNKYSTKPCVRDRLLRETEDTYLGTDTGIDTGLGTEITYSRQTTDKPLTTSSILLEDREVENSNLGLPLVRLIQGEVTLSPLFNAISGHLSVLWGYH